MSLEIKGINNLIKKLDNLTNINTEEIIKDVAKDMETAIKDEAKTFSKNYEYVGECEPRKYGRSVFVDVGLKNENAPWDEWKELWYHNWGYRDFGLNFQGSPYIETHKLWFDNAVKGAEGEVKKKLKNRLQEELNKNIRQG